MAAKASLSSATDSLSGTGGKQSLPGKIPTRSDLSSKAGHGYSAANYASNRSHQVKPNVHASGAPKSLAGNNSQEMLQGSEDGGLGGAAAG